ncbi:MAG: hypothetical protein V4792_00825 [Pseudomonadota bacterium]
MKLSAFEFANAVDRQIEELSTADFQLRSFLDPYGKTRTSSGHRKVRSFAVI